MLDIRETSEEITSNINWSDPKWAEGKENKDIYTYIAVPGTVTTLTTTITSFVKKLIQEQRPLNGRIYLKDFDGRDVFVFMCNSNNLLNIPQNNSWQCNSNYNVTPGSTCIVLPTKEAGPNMSGIEFIFAKKVCSN